MDKFCVFTLIPFFRLSKYILRRPLEFEIMYLGVKKSFEISSCLCAVWTSQNTYMNLKNFT